MYHDKHHCGHSRGNVDYDINYIYVKVVLLLLLLLLLLFKPVDQGFNSRTSLNIFSVVIFTTV